MKSFLNRGLMLAALFLGAFAAVRSQQTQRFPQFENEDVKVWKSVVMPKSPLTMHRHDHPRVIIALSGGTMKIVEQGGASEEHVWETGKAYWLPANPPGTMHADVNAGDKPIRSHGRRAGKGEVTLGCTYSVRSAFAGSVDAARRAGISPATNAAMASVTIDTVITLASTPFIS